MSSSVPHIGFQEPVPKVIDTNTLKGYTAVVSNFHSVEETQRIALVILSQNAESAANIAKTLSSKQAKKQGIWWHDGESYFTYIQKTMAKADGPPETDVVYIQDVLHDAGLAAKFDDSKIIPVSPYLLDPADPLTRALRISGKAPYIRVQLRMDLTDYFVPILYLELANLDLNWLLINEKSTTFSELNNTGGASPVRKNGFATPIKAALARQTKSTKSTNSTPARPVKTIKPLETPKGKIIHNALQTMPKTPRNPEPDTSKSRPISILWPATLAFVIIIILAITPGRYRWTLNNPEPAPILSTIKELVVIDDKVDVQPFVSPKTITQQIRLYFIAFVAMIRQIFPWNY